MKKLTDKFLNGFVKMSVPLCIFTGIAHTIMFVEKLYEYNLNLYQSGAVLIPFIVGMVTFYGLAILIPVVRKRQYHKHVKKDQGDSEGE